MKRHKFKPTWRGAGREVELVERPTPEWFAALTLAPSDSPRQTFRFSLLADGSLYFGDAWTVLHHDIMQWRGPRRGGVTPLFVGVVLRVPGGPWRCALIQYFMEGSGEPDRFCFAKGLLGQLDGWKAVCIALGENPFDAPQWGAEP